MKDRNIFSGSIALLIVLAFCAFAVWTGLRPLPAANQHWIDISLGALISQFVNVVGYYFGSSRDAAQANQRIAAATPAAQSPTVAQATAEPEKKS